MGKVGPVYLCLLFIFSLSLPSQMVQSATTEERKEITDWFQNLHHAKQKLTHLHFYFHDVVFGPKPTSMAVASAPNTLKSPTLFGLVNVFDNILTKGPEPTSQLLGQAQGLYGYASQEEVSLLFAVNFVFTSGEYNGSSLTILGRNPVAQTVRELPILGGTGVFRLASGFATAKTYFSNASLAIVEYNVEALHY